MLLFFNFNYERKILSIKKRIKRTYIYSANEKNIILNIYKEKMKKNLLI